MAMRFRSGENILRRRFVLRLAISEERANGIESERWCGVPRRQGVPRVAKRAFLFQICTLPRRGKRKVPVNHV